MDIAKVQKMNQMAVYLQKHNIIQDRDAALKNAEKIYGMGNDDFSKKEVIEMTDEDPNEIRKDVRKIAFALRDAMNEIRDLKSQIKKMESQFNNLIVNQRPRQIVQEAVIERPNTVSNQRQEAPKEPVQAKLAQHEKKIECPIDRNNVAPSEVAIEKMFYFGQK